MSQSDPGLKAFKSVNFDWTVRLQDVWQTPEHHFPDLHKDARNHLLEEFQGLLDSPSPGSPLGRFLIGASGVGKTHFLGNLRAEAWRMGLGFVLVDMTDVRDFWETVAQGYLTSLESPPESPQYRLLLRKFLGSLAKEDTVSQAVRLLPQRKSTQLKTDIDKVLFALSRRHPTHTRNFQDAIRALICINSADYDIANIGSSWLQGLECEEALARELAFQRRQAVPREIVRAMSWLMNLAGPTLLAFDQMDPIVYEVARQNQVNDPSEQNVARRIMDQIGNGLAALRDTTTRTLTVVSCLESSYTFLTQQILISNLNRFHENIRLRAPDAGEYVGLLMNRLGPAYRKANFSPPYPTWPFKPEAVAALQQQSPREVLQKCEAHRRHCLTIGRVEELERFSLASKDIVPPVPVDDLAKLDQDFDRFRKQCQVRDLCDEQHEDERLAPLYQCALRCLLKESQDALPPRVEAAVEINFSGGKTTKPLHARLRLQHQEDNDREEHFCLRVLLKTHHSAFNARLKSAITQSGIDRNLSFRRLTIIRNSSPIPGGKSVQELVRQFTNDGGQIHQAGEEEIQDLYALSQMEASNNPAFAAWLKARTPLGKLHLGDILAPRSCFDRSAAQVAIKTAPPQEEPSWQNPPPQPAHNGIAADGHVPPSPRDMPLNELPAKEQPPKEQRPTLTPSGGKVLVFGQRILGPERLGDDIGVPIGELAKHTVLLAGSGSGKTVAVRRIVEEAALLGIPSIIIDGANDIATFDEPRDGSPFWKPDDADRARRFQASHHMVVWTPGKESGNPLVLRPLPDFAAIRGDSEELEAAVGMAADALSDVVVSGSGANANSKGGILKMSLQYLAQTYDAPTLTDYVDLLENLPPEAALNIVNEARMAREMADALKIRLGTNPLWKEQGSPLDPAVLFGDDLQRPTTRISVINLSWLSGLAVQRSFVNQLAMILFSWIKKNPNPPGRALRGLLVMDEAKDFVPSVARSECKASILRLGAQARKYGLGLVFATQHPKDIDHKLVGNCATHLYGLNNSPASLATLKDLMRQKGGNGDDLSRLQVGQFYFHSAGWSGKPPLKIKVPDCLSNKRGKPMEEAEIWDKARHGRGKQS